MMSDVFPKPHDYRLPDAIEILFSKEEIDASLRRLSLEIQSVMGNEFLIIALLKGSFVFAADLVRALHHAGCAPQIDFMTISSYGNQKHSSGQLMIHHSVTDELKHKPVLLVDDILESGQTLDFACHDLLAKGAASVRTCVLLDKPGKRKKGIEADFVGFEIPDAFVVGYGLDYAGYYRELPFIGVL